MTSSIDERRGVFGIEPISRLLPIAPSSYCENVAKRTDADRLSICVRSDISLRIEARRILSRCLVPTCYVLLSNVGCASLSADFAQSEM